MFKFKGKRSDEMHLIIENNVGFASPERDLEFIAIPGRDGELIIDNKRYGSVTRTIPCVLSLPKDESVEHVATKIGNWLNVDHQYHDFHWAEDPEFVYRAMFYESFNLQRVIRRFGRLVLNFKMHPIKYLKSSLVERSVASGFNLHNPLTLPSKPIIKIVGHGDMRIRINDQEVVLSRIEEGGVIIDSENQTVTTLDGRWSQARHLVTYPFPVLEVGNNVITYQADNSLRLSRIDSVSIVPRFGELI